MKTAIFIKSYEGDFKWLNYCLLNIQKHVTGVDEVRVVLPSGSSPFIPDIEKIDKDYVTFNGVDEEGQGYLFQQYVKLCADQFTTADLIIFVDSDTMIHDAFDPSMMLEDGKIILLKTPYTAIEVPWKPITEKALGKSIEYEFMRRLPLAFWRETITDCRNELKRIHGDLKNYILNSNGFSEFNALGAYAHIYQPERYKFINTSTDTWKELPVKQYWSWGGISENIQEELENSIQ